MYNYTMPKGWRLVKESEFVRYNDLVFYTSHIRGLCILPHNGYRLSKFYDEHDYYATAFPEQLFIRKLEFTPKGNKIIN